MDFVKMTPDQIWQLQIAKSILAEKKLKEMYKKMMNYCHNLEDYK